MCVAASLLAWPIAVLLSIFIFDAPGSGSNILTVLIAISVLCYPIPIYFGLEGFWKNRKHNTKVALYKYTAMGLSSPAIFITLLIALELFCDGKFNCQ